jgi:crotonobetainyl-CoA:carnitine CoA-transferase CaiB-like acyl-CoA transferase
MSASKPLRRPLDGVRVLDFSMMIAGPLCTRMLADVGADVIKIEPPSGDHIRAAEPLRDGFSTYFGQLNCGKRSMVLDLKSPDGVAVARRLAAVSDIVVENFRPGVMQRLGLDYATLAAKNPRLIYCAISGFGQVGPGADKPAYAPIVHAASGHDLANLYYQDGQERPAKTGIFAADVLASINAFGAVQTALFQREREGRGQFIDVTLMEGMLNLLIYEFQEAQFPSKKRRHLYVPVQAKDGFVIVAPINQNNFEHMADAVGHPEWKTDARFLTSRIRAENWDALMRLVEAWTETRTAQECEEHLMAAGVPCSRYLRISEAMADPQLVARGSFSTVVDGGGSFLVPNLPFQMSGATVTAKPFVPRLGEHGRQILDTVLGCDAAEIDRLARSGAIGG